jgi:hypothetical protein
MGEWAKRRNGEMAKWRNGEMAKWRNGEMAKLTLPFYYRGWAGPGLIVEAKMFWRFAPAIALSPFRPFAVSLFRIGYWLFRLGFDPADHFSDGVFQANEKCPRNDGVTDVKLVPPFYVQQSVDVVVIDAVAGIDNQSSFGCEFVCSSEPLEFVFAKLWYGVGIGSGMQLDGFSSQISRRMNLFTHGLDEHAHANTGGL